MKRKVRLIFGICRYLSLHNMNLVSKGKVERGADISLLVAVKY